MLVYFMRHSETEWNEMKLLNGVTDTNLSERGKEKAVIKRKEFQNIEFDKVYTSPLIRAIQTAEILTGLSSDNIEKKEELREREFGSLEGKKLSDITFKQIEEKSEGHINIYRRVIKFIKCLEKNKSDDTILVVSHCSVLRHIYAYINKQKYELINIDNLEYFLAEYNGNKWKRIV